MLSAIIISVLTSATARLVLMETELSVLMSTNVKRILTVATRARTASIFLADITVNAILDMLETEQNVLMSWIAIKIRTFVALTEFASTLLATTAASVSSDTHQATMENDVKT